jgi:hypothetical protein
VFAAFRRLRVMTVKGRFRDAIYQTSDAHRLQMRYYMKLR